MTQSLQQSIDGQIEVAAKVLAECMDYPWAEMPEQGRANMRKNARLILDAATQVVAGQPMRQWQSMTDYGQVKVGDFISFFIGDDHFDERVKFILNAGSDREELIYNKEKNYYVISKNVLTNFGNVKDFRFFSNAVASNAGKAPSDQNAHLVPGEELVRFCAHCGSIGEVDHSKHRDCCPDGNTSRYIPKNMALRCKQLFDKVIENILAKDAPASSEPAVAAIEAVKS